MIEGIRSEKLDSVWHGVAPIIKKALDRQGDGRFELEDVYHAIKNQTYQLWLVPGGVWVTQVICYPRSKRLELVFASGTYDDWLTHFEDLKKFARSNGCEAIEMSGRKGWSRRCGFEVIETQYRVWI